MSDAFAISELSMINDMRRLDLISHNLANALTGGYKRDIAVSRSFAAALESGLAGFAAVDALSDNTVPTLSAVTDYSQGAFRNTGNALDVAIEGDGFFELNAGGRMLYTRQGSFHLDGLGRLLAPGDLPVNGLAGEIRLGADDPRIDKRGMIWIDDEAVAQLKLVRFSDPSALVRAAGGGYRIAGAARPQSLTSPALRQGFVETSNVEVTDEMIRMMTTVRHFEATQQVIRGYDEMLGTAIETIAEF